MDSDSAGLSDSLRKGVYRDMNREGKMEWREGERERDGWKEGKREISSSGLWGSTVAFGGEKERSLV